MVPRERIAALVAVALLVSGCAAGRDGSRSLPTIPAVVDRVVDGDTAWVRLGDGRTEKVRFIGVDSPESTTRKEPFGEAAAAYTRSVLEAGRAVELETDVDQRDRYGRLLAYVWLSRPETAAATDARDAMLNAMLVRDGYATVLTVPPNVAYADLFVALQLEARRAARGVWALGP